MSEHAHIDVEIARRIGMLDATDRHDLHLKTQIFDTKIAHPGCQGVRRIECERNEATIRKRYRCPRGELIPQDFTRVSERTIGGRTKVS